MRAQRTGGGLPLGAAVGSHSRPALIRNSSGQLMSHKFWAEVGKLNIGHSGLTASGMIYPQVGS